MTNQTETAAIANPKCRAAGGSCNCSNSDAISCPDQYATTPQPVSGSTILSDKRAPVQGYKAGIPWSLHLEAYDAHSKKWAPQPALIDLEGRNCRGGFGTEELDQFIPGWRERASEIGRLKAENEELRAALAAPASVPQDRDSAQLANLLLVNPENGQKFTFAGPLESWGMGLNQVKMVDDDGNEWTLVAGLREGYKTEAQRNVNLLRAVEEELAALAVAQPAASEPVAASVTEMELALYRDAYGPKVPSEAITDVLAERRRQMAVEGWTHKHDDDHDGGEMAKAAACYAYPQLTTVVGLCAWPWHADFWKPRDDRRNLVKAGALILAEIERIDRATTAEQSTVKTAEGK